MRLYSADCCSPCQKVKAFMEENNLSFEIIDTDTDKIKGELVIPLLIDGANRIRGEEDIISYLKNRMIP